MSQQQDMIAILDDGLSTSTVEQVKHPFLNSVAPPVQYAQMNDFKDAISIVKEDPKTQRESFLIEYYKRILKQHLIILKTFLFGLMELFANIVVDFGYNDNSFRQTFYVFVTTLIIIALGLPIIRSISVVVKHQTTKFYVQTALIGLIIIGVGINTVVDILQLQSDESLLNYYLNWAQHCISCICKTQFNLLSYNCYEVCYYGFNRYQFCCCIMRIIFRYQLILSPFDSMPPKYGFFQLLNI